MNRAQNERSDKTHKCHAVNNAVENEIKIVIVQCVNVFIFTYQIPFSIRDKTTNVSAILIL